MQIPREMGWMEFPNPKLRLTLQRLNKLRRHLFGDAAAALSNRLSDVELAQLMVVSAGCCSWTPQHRTVVVVWIRTTTGASHATVSVDQ